MMKNLTVCNATYILLYGENMTNLMLKKYIKNYFKFWKIAYKNIFT